MIDPLEMIGKIYFEIKEVYYENTKIITLTLILFLIRDLVTFRPQDI